MSIVRSIASPFAGLCNRARLGFPRRYFHGVGDDLICSTVFRELKKRAPGSIAMATEFPALFEKNPDVDRIVFHPRPRLKNWLREGLPWVTMTYAKYLPETDGDEPPDEHVLIKLCRLAEITGAIELRPYLFLTTPELTTGIISENQIVMQSSGMSAADPMRNKEWFAHRFQEVCSELRTDVSVIQIGSPQDPKLEGATDLRGKTTLRETAAIMANSLVFVGLAGGLMHLARAVDCRSVIVYGGREKPTQTGYVANKNLYSQVRCAPCWLRNPCDYDRKCMEMISVEQVIAATAEQISKYNTLLEVQTANL